MTFRARLRRAFPYLVIGIGGFALAYVLIFFFVLPSKIIPPRRVAVATDSSTVLQPIDTAIHPDSIAPLQSFVAPPQQPLRQSAPDLVGMALPDARRILNGNRLHTVIARDTTSDQPLNTVLAQNPPAGSLIGPGGTITLTVSRRDSQAVAPTRTPGSGMTPILRADSDSTRRDTTSHPDK